MKASLTALMIAGLLLAGILTGCSREESGSAADTRHRPAGAMETSSETAVKTSAERTLPRVVDLGRNTCIPCKKMAPILEELEQEFDGTAIIEVIDLREHAEAASRYGIRLIPTQVFFDSTGVEVWRHEGFLSKDAIVAKLEQLGARPVDK